MLAEEAGLEAGDKKGRMVHQVLGEPMLETSPRPLESTPIFPYPAPFHLYPLAVNIKLKPKLTFGLLEYGRNFYIKNPGIFSRFPTPLPCPFLQ